MRVTEGLEPETVFEYFEKICSIPHDSYNEKQLSDYCVSFAKEHGLEYYQDDLYNVIIIKEASEGYEDHEPVIIQGHLDMVCEKTADTEIDFRKDGLKLAIDNGFLHATGTTLGGDDGIAVAYALAILASDSISHPRLEVVFTVSEETGMEGAGGIDISMLKGHMLLNIDSEEEGCILTSCAGGSHVSCTLDAGTHKPDESDVFYRITIDGLTGGHSGCEIDKGRANADVLMARLLLMLAGDADTGIAELSGGRKDNAIPTSSQAVICFDAGENAKLQGTLNEFTQIIKDEYRSTDPGLSVRLEKLDNNGLTEQYGTVTQAGQTQRIASFITALPYGVIAMSHDMPGMVETSLNLGVMNYSDGRLELGYLLRSSKESSLDYLETKMQCVAGAFGAECEISARYPAWEYAADSKLRQCMIETYHDMFGRDMKVESIHAGVECGILSAKAGGLDCVSFGPDILDIHTPQERLDIASAKRTWDYLLEVLKRL